MANVYDVRRLEAELGALRQVQAHITAYQYPPTYRELAAALGEGWSKSKCADVLGRLAKKGFVNLGGEGNARAIQVLKGPEDLELELRTLDAPEASLERPPE